MYEIPRASGILLHLTSLPGLPALGRLGPEARDFVAFLQGSGQSYWQVLPIGPVLSHLGFSPYASPSAFAGNEDFISLEKLSQEGLLSVGELGGIDASAPPGSVREERARLLERAADRFRGQGGVDRPDYRAFYDAHRHWLDDYALFMALAQEQGTCHWPDWERPLAKRQPAALEDARRRCAAPIGATRFAQFCFRRQWQELRADCQSRGVRIIGDIPYYVSMDGADTWAHPGLFELEGETGAPRRVAGVPPDYFSADGQRWGNPLYAWRDREGGGLCEATYQWWRARLGHMLELVDLVRIDHFRGFEAYWAVPAGCPTAREGEWVKGPGELLFRRLAADLGDLPLIAEDLGVITPSVEALRDGCGFPGMKVLQFAFDGKPDNPYLPHNFSSRRCLVFTGTHDNNTTRGWFSGAETNAQTRQYVCDYLGLTKTDDIHWQMIRLAQRSTAQLSVIPMQDVLGLGAEARMNVPGKAGGNWQWALGLSGLEEAAASPLGYLTRLTNRWPGGG